MPSMINFSFRNELWAIDDEEVDEMLQWAIEQHEYDLHELWFAIFFDTAHEGVLKLSYKDGPSTYRSN